MPARRGPQNPWFGPRLPIAPDPEPRKPTPCDFNERHTGGIRWALVRYGRSEKSINLCPACYNALPSDRPDPLHVEEAA